MNEEKEYRDTLKNNIAVIEHYGIKKQMPVWIEEMSELTKNICKWARKYDELEGDISPQLLSDLKEEITDVTICLDQLKYAIHFIEDDLMKEYKWKVDRQLKRIEEQK
ncbi:MAG: hypothetical protein OSJ63_07495 [Bacilli bacterium]|nr:hypothetical protein [Bacilli bacterium]